MARRGKALCRLGAGGHAELLSITRPAVAAWADRHGYDLLERTELSHPERPASWNKVPMVAEALETHRSVLWLDADAAIVRDAPDPGEVLDRRRWMGLVAHEYGGQRVPNLGVFVMRSTRGARALLDRLWSMEEYLHHKWWENAAFLDLLGYDVTSEPITRAGPSPLDGHLAWLGLEWNSIPGAHEADEPVVVHLAGQSDADRRRLLAEWTGRSA